MKKYIEYAEKNSFNYILNEKECELKEIVSKYKLYKFVKIKTLKEKIIFFFIGNKKENFLYSSLFKNIFLNHKKYFDDERWYAEKGNEKEIENLNKIIKFINKLLKDNNIILEK